MLHPCRWRSGFLSYQHLLLTAEKKFWRCVESGEPPALFGVEPPAGPHRTNYEYSISGRKAGDRIGRKKTVDFGVVEGIYSLVKRAVL